ncbi:MAG: BTAD domain-containing putative transcriptional regulator, partial [Candidatus Palauibacterales bacterium]|nr:BTAD domain-containing putative transcriptional regulator [Candidatus Palauibacterales bacterium]
MTELELRLLGGAALEGADGPVTGPASRRFPLALLALLASAPSRELARSKVVGLLWPDSPERDGRNRLNTYVHQVRSELGDEVLVSVGDRLRLNTDALDCDVWRFEEALEAEDPRRAADLYEGPFLDGFALGGSASFEKRVDRTRDRLRRAHLEALETLAEEAWSRGAPEEAATWWRRRSEEDPWDSRVVRRLMEALAAADNRPAALRAAREHARRLEEEIGTGPGEGVRELARRLKEGEAEEAVPGPPAAGAGSAEPPENASPSGGELSPRTVAVLPFENLGEGEGAETFAAGLHDDLITELSRAPDLAVISRTSVARFGGREGTASEVGRQLGAGTLVQGGVRAAGDRVRLNVQLVDARDDAHRWAESFDRRLTPEALFEIQGELASRIAGSLHAELTPEGDGEGERSGRAPTGDLEAYRLCVQGRALLDQRTGDDLRQAVDYFRRTLERDPEHPLAWSGLAEALALLDFYGHPVPGDAPDALEAARRGVEADPGSGEARTSLGIVRSLRLQGPEALDDLERARELAPSHAEAHVWLGWVRLVQGEAERALGPLRRAVELNPLGPALRVYLGEALLATGSPEEGLRQARRAGELQPGYALAAFVEGLVLHHMDRHREAADRLEKALALTRARGTPSRPEARAALAATRAAAGQEERARELLARIEEDREGRARAFSAALARAALGDAEGAFEALARVDRWG